MLVRFALIGTVVLTVTVILVALPGSQSDSTVAPVPLSKTSQLTTCDPQASPDTQVTLSKLSAYSISRRHLLSGQNVGHTAVDLLQDHYRTWTRLTKFRDQPAPAVMAIDLGLDNIPLSVSPILHVVRPHVRAGGVVSLSMHPRNPWTNGSYDDLQRGSFESLVTPGNEAYERWQQTTNQVAYLLKRLQQEGITVLWRPLHEANGYWFWWCCGSEQNQPGLTPKQYQTLWQQMFTRFTEDHDLHNLLWVYSANARLEDRVLAPLDMYPGNESVDVVGLDYYGPNIEELNQRGCYDALRSTGKVLALTEFGAKPMDGSLRVAPWVEAMESQFPDFAYFVFWHSWPDHRVALGDLNEVDVLMSAPRLHHLRDVQAGIESAGASQQ